MFLDGVQIGSIGGTQVDSRYTDYQREFSEWVYTLHCPADDDTHQASQLELSAFARDSYLNAIKRVCWDTSGALQIEANNAPLPIDDMYNSAAETEWTRVHWTEWTRGHVHDWLQTLAVPNGVVQAAFDEHVDGSMLPHTQKSDWEGLGMTGMGSTRILVAIRKLQVDCALLA